jgi:hypothetical protein
MIDNKMRRHIALAIFIGLSAVASQAYARSKTDVPKAIA